MADETTHTATDTFTLAIDYSQSVAEMVAAGNYKYVHRKITDENFPVGEGEPEVEAVIVSFNRVISSDAVVTEFERQELLPATMPQLLVFGAQHSDQQCQFLVVALGSVWTDSCGVRNVGCLWGHPTYRWLSLAYNDWWRERYRFLAVRK